MPAVTVLACGLPMLEVGIYPEVRRVHTKRASAVVRSNLIIVAKPSYCPVNMGIVSNIRRVVIFTVQQISSRPQPALRALGDQRLNGGRREVAPRPPRASGFALSAAPPPDPWRGWPVATLLTSGGGAEEVSGRRDNIPPARIVNMGWSARHLRRVGTPARFKEHALP